MQTAGRQLGKLIIYKKNNKLQQKLLKALLMTEEGNKISTMATKDNKLMQVRLLAKQPGW